MIAEVWPIGGVVVASLFSMLFSTLTYSLRDFSRARLSDALERRGHPDWARTVSDRSRDFMFSTAVARLVANMLILLFMLELAHNPTWPKWLHYLAATLCTAVILMFCSVAIPHALARHAGEAILASHARFLFTWQAILSPMSHLMNITDRLVGRIAGVSEVPSDHDKAQELEEEIRSVVAEGQKEGVVDATEKQMIESVIEFRDTTVGQIMTARTEIAALAKDTSLREIIRTVESSGHSRIPIFDGSMDKIIGVLYARDLLTHLMHNTDRVDVNAAMRQPLYVPKTKNLRDLLTDFRLQKIHIAIVLDEYGGTAGLVTIEDVLEELVGDISDEHEPHMAAMFHRLSDTAVEADARIYIDELNRLLSLNLPEDQGFDTLGGFLTTTIGKIPANGAQFEHGGATFTILDAEPQKVNRVRIELLPQTAEAPTSI